MEYESWQELITVPNPAAAANATYQISGRAYELIETVRFTVATSAVVGTRTPFLAFTDGDGNEFIRWPIGFTLPASNSNVCQYAADYNGSITSDAVATMATMTKMVLPSGYGVTIGNFNAQAGDQISAIKIVTRRLPSGESGWPVGARPYEPMIEQ